MHFNTPSCKTISQTDKKEILTLFLNNQSVGQSWSFFQAVQVLGPDLTFINCHSWTLNRITARDYLDFHTPEPRKKTCISVTFIFHSLRQSLSVFVCEWIDGSFVLFPLARLTLCIRDPEVRKGSLALFFCSFTFILTANCNKEDRRRKTLAC